MSQKSTALSMLIMDHRMCLACLVSRTAMTREAVQTALDVIGRALVLQRFAEKSCDVCGARTSCFMIESR